MYSTTTQGNHLLEREHGGSSGDGGRAVQLAHLSIMWLELRGLPQILFLYNAEAWVRGWGREPSTPHMHAGAGAGSPTQPQPHTHMHMPHAHAHACTHAHAHATCTCTCTCTCGHPHCRHSVRLTLTLTRHTSQTVAARERGGEGRVGEG
eukprot:scaffold84658_cov75-Phaeocystis_antarctica.AAC.1